MIRRHRPCSAMDPRDKVIAFLSISMNDGHALAGVIEPDYTCSVQALYITTTRVVLRSAGHLEYFTNKELRRWISVHGLPSWVPDYATQRRPNSLGFRNNLSPWAACGNLKWKPDSRGWDDPLLDIQGIMIGRIQMVAETKGGCDWSRYLESICGVAQGLSHNDKIPLNNEALQSVQTPLEVVWRTLIADTCKHKHPASPDYGEKFIGWALLHIPFLKGNCETNAQLLEKAIPLLKLIDQEPSTSSYKQTISVVKSKLEHSLTSDNEHADMWEDFKREFKVTAFLRRLFRIDDGRLGNELEDLEVGDEVWILAGNSKPAVLRKLESGNRIFVGEAYVHGLMHWEVEGLGKDIVDIILE